MNLFLIRRSMLIEFGRMLTEVVGVHADIHLDAGITHKDK